MCAQKKQKKMGAGKKRPESSFHPVSLFHAENSHSQRETIFTLIFPSFYICIFSFSSFLVIIFTNINILT